MNGSDDSTVHVARPGLERRPLGAVLRVSSEAAQPKSLRLTEGAVVVGSGEGSDLVLREPTVSRRHAEFELVADGVAVRDLGSRNGTYYLGQRVEKMIVEIGARLRLGSVEVAVDVDVADLTSSEVWESDHYRGMVGVSEAMRRLFSILRRLEGSLASVLVQGESGVGKELVAQAIHEGSRAAGGPFVALNSGAIPNGLVASELFGHRRGAFTGASENRKGAFEQADGGTLFLDEIGELPLELQPTLLRVLEQRKVRAIGADVDRPVNVRFIAATHRDLEADVAEGTFREDLYYRLAVIRVEVPPLRVRPADIEPLARHFAALSGIELPPDIIADLAQRSFPGNARQLRNAIESYAALGALPAASRAAKGGLEHALRPFVDASREYAAQKEELVESFTSEYVRILLERTGGNQTLAARIAGLDRTHFGRLVARHSKPKR